MIPLRRALRRRRAKVHLKRCGLKAFKTRFLTLSCHEGDVHTYTEKCMTPRMLKPEASPGYLAIGLIGAALPALDQLEPPGAWPDAPLPVTFCAAGPGRVRHRAARRRAAQRAGGGRAPARRAPPAAPAAAAHGRGAAGSRAARCAPQVPGPAACACCRPGFCMQAGSGSSVAYRLAVEDPEQCAGLEEGSCAVLLSP